MDLKQRKLWNENHKKLTNMILKPNEHNQAVELFLSQHALMYSSKMADSDFFTLEDELFDQITEETLRKYPVMAPDTKNSILWHVWHITRIEDMTMNVLVGERDQVFFAGNWQKPLNISFVHTGNGMSEDEVQELSSTMDIAALLAYRLEVGRRTREIIGALEPGHFKQKATPAGIKKLENQGAVKHEAAWLLEYWGKKNIAGLVLMPATRHNFLHLNKAIRIKRKIQK